jgi:hypothetical protein
MNLAFVKLAIVCLALNGHGCQHRIEGHTWAFKSLTTCGAVYLDDAEIGRVRYDAVCSFAPQIRRR